MELPTISRDHMQGRAQTERNFSAIDQVKAICTIYGWLRADGKLWERNQKVHVKSPMLILDEPLTVKSATFTQDSGTGTRTTLELCNPLALNNQTPQVGSGR